MIIATDLLKNNELKLEIHKFHIMCSDFYCFHQEIVH